ncbi:copper resistance D family protein [Streptomyces soliscabiei]|uniref:copper resistance D family protein n=1 Tax=Streptomyces soliscabiei TaxID=588897 RepID=UPI0029BE29A4|nr:CopD family protein [Streptomyces sp. NY05-11A]MDX2677496.1 CopD family protein [Streptomyces sp. NY05-11A]
MALIRPTEAIDTARRTGLGPGRAVALLVLVGLGALVPLLGPSVAAHSTGEATTPDSGVVALLRAALFAALSVQLGEVFASALARRLPDAPAGRPGEWAPYAAVVGFAAAATAGELAPHGHGSRSGVLALLEAIAFAVAGLCALSRRPDRQLWPLAAVVLAEALRAHPPTEHTPLVGSGLTVVHLTCSALWAGGLLNVLRTLRRWGGGEAGTALLGLYARVAAVLFAGVTATGLCSSLRRMPSQSVLDQLTTTAYGRVLLAKVLLVGAVALLALWARTRLRRAADPLTACSPARVEIVTLGVVVAVSGLLTTLPLPIKG